MKQPSRRRGASGKPLRQAISDKENEIIKKELADPGAAKRNLPLLQEQFRNNRSLRRILFNPFQMLAIAQTVEREMQSQTSLSGQQVQDDEFYNRLIRQIGPYINPQTVLDYLIGIAKQTRIKREKRALLWSAANLATTLASGRPATDAAVIRALIIASLGNSFEIAQNVADFLDGKEPYHFSHEKLTEDRFGETEWQTLLETIQPYREDFFLSISMRALELFDQIDKPWGVRYYRIPHYSTAIKTAERKLIVLPGESEAPKTDDEDENELMQRVAEALRNDIALGYLSRLDRDVVASLRSAAFGVVDFERDPALLNAASFAAYFPSEWNPFILRLYSESGEHAERINPPDETNLILDMKSNAASFELHLRYADLLFEKEEWAGAHNMYRHAASLKQERDEAIMEKLGVIEEKLLPASTPTGESDEQQA